MGTELTLELMFHTFYTMVSVYMVIAGLYIGSKEKFLPVFLGVKVGIYCLWLFHFLLYLFTHLKKYWLVKNEDCTLLYSSSTDNPFYKDNLERSLDFKYSLCQICLKRGSSYIYM